MKRFFALLLTVATLATITLPVLAVENATVMASDESNSVQRAEETEWRYRVVDGMMQRRLWSLTNGYWLTDWMYI